MAQTSSSGHQAKPFLRALVGGLAREGVSPDRIRYEFFGPADELLEQAD